MKKLWILTLSSVTIIASLLFAPGLDSSAGKTDVPFSTTSSKTDIPF